MPVSVILKTNPNDAELINFSPDVIKVNSEYHPELTEK
jgi:hypothetical protein